MRVLLLAGLAAAFMLALISPGRAAAQSITLDLDDVPLARALGTVRAQTGLDLVYARRLVEGVRASCRYTGDDAEVALHCTLAGTPVHAERVRRGQYVLVPRSGAEADLENAAEPARLALAGYVIDAVTGERLPGAHVFLPALHVGAVTNDAGYFAISGLPNSRYRVRISFVGYQTRDTTLAPQPPPRAGSARGNSARADSARGQHAAARVPVRIALRPVTLPSEGVTVARDPDAADAAQHPPGMLAIPLDDLDRLPTLGEPDLFKALEWTPGIRKSGVLNGGLSVRGGRPDQNLYLLDGAPIYHPWHAFSLISTFQTGTLKATRLYRDAFPAQYGGRLASVLDARLRDGTRAEPAATAAVGVLSARFRVESPLSEHVSFMISGRRSYVDALLGREHPVSDDAGRRDTLRTGYYFYDQSAKLTARLDARQRVTVSAYQGRDDLDLRLPFDLSLDFGSWLRPADLFFEVRQAWTNRVVSARHEWLVSPRLFLTTTAYVSQYDSDEASLVQPTTTSVLDSDYGVRLRDAGLRLEATAYHSVTHELQAGLHVARLRFRSDLDYELRRSADLVESEAEASRLGAWEAAVYVQDVWKPTARWTVQPGVRLSAFTGGDHAYVRPRLSASYAVRPSRLIVRAAAGAHVQYLHRLRDRQALAYDLVSSRWVPASEAVRPSTSWQASAGVQARPRPWLTVEADAYARRAAHVLVPDDVYRTRDGLVGPGIEVGALLGQYTPATEKAYGVEMRSVTERGPWQLRLGGAVARTLVRVADPGTTPQPEGFRPSDLDVPVSMQAALSWRAGRWEATLAADVRSGDPISEPVARYRLDDVVGDAPDGTDGPTTYLYRPQINNGRLPMYVRFDGMLAYRFRALTANWRARLTVYNITNRANVVTRRFEPLAAGVRTSDRRGLPILPLLELEMTL